MNAMPKDFQRKTYFENDDFRVYLEYFSEQLFIHVAIFRATPSVFTEIKEKWAEVMIDAYFQGFEEVFAYSQDIRIIEMIGGAEKVGEHENYEVWKWVLS